jgi:hypothetical protein
MPKLSGAFLAIVVAAALVVAVAIAGSALAFDQLRAIGSRYMVAVAFIAAWSLLFLVMTMMRARATPRVASAGLFLWSPTAFALRRLRAADRWSSTCWPKRCWRRASAATCSAASSPKPIIAVAFPGPEPL